MKKPTKLVFEIGDIVHNNLTHELGKIIRIVNADVQRATASTKETHSPAYVVSLPPTALLPAREALWSESTIDQRLTRRDLNAFSL